MKIDLQELQQLAAVQPREDMYAAIHKALRAFMADTLLALGRVDVDDDADLARVTGQVVDLVDFCLSHLQHENAFVHTAIEARAPGASAAIAHDHIDHEREIAELRSAAQDLRQLEAALRPAAAHGLYRALAVFVAENMLHMNVEETAHNALLWSRYTDVELRAIHDALVASIPPQELMLGLRWMLPFMTPRERLGMLTGIRAQAPAPAFAAILDVVRPHLGEREWAKLARGLGIDAVPGLTAG
ncbi:hypothetical protein ACPWT1_02425 [Ramlibacter sp. MMS24-I3-19]|uniref:hemerythrin domain-containing protein n=1 Tax=Ramlibacter sp. MMS24-I3-19 TaxID=3416606 RepID=UPI003D019697